VTIGLELLRFGSCIVLLGVGLHVVVTWSITFHVALNTDAVVLATSPFGLSDVQQLD
jgi:hypothetical protein